MTIRYGYVLAGMILGMLLAGLAFVSAAERVHACQPIPTPPPDYVPPPPPPAQDVFANATELYQGKVISEKVKDGKRITETLVSRVWKGPLEERRIDSTDFIGYYPECENKWKTPPNTQIGDEILFGGYGYNGADFDAITEGQNPIPAPVYPPPEPWVKSNPARWLAIGLIFVVFPAAYVLIRFQNTRRTKGEKGPT